MRRAALASVLVLTMALSALALSRGGRAVSRGLTSKRCASASIRDIGLTSTNTLTAYLEEEKAEVGKQFVPRQITKHFVCVRPEPVPTPSLLAVSRSCMDAIGLDLRALENEEGRQELAGVLSGNVLAAGLDNPYAVNYGCHCYGTWFGQLGDGRAMSLGEVRNPETQQSYELQLKGCGRTPFSRGFDGRAVLRSSVREFLVSESMHHLRVPTTRALSLVATGIPVRRPWYTARSDGDLSPPESASGSRQYRGREDVKFQPDTIIMEPGAVVCRVGVPGLLRFGQLELFAARQQWAELTQLANYACLKEYPEILAAEGVALPAGDEAAAKAFVGGTGPLGRYVSLLRAVAASTAHLAVEWLRVGYCQGNMNSDNTLLGGRTIDYGPYGWLERFEPMYQPFTSDQEGKFAFINQATAMNVNVVVLSKSFEQLLKHVSQHHQDLGQSGLTEAQAAGALADASAELASIAKEEFASLFQAGFDDMRRRKLGLRRLCESVPEDAALWSQLSRLLCDSWADYTIFFRLLVDVHKDCAALEAREALALLSGSFYEAAPAVGEGRRAAGPRVDSPQWLLWLDKYLARLRADGDDGRGERVEQQAQTNPKFVLRNWMAVLAYEAASQGDYSVIEELMRVLQAPYEEQDAETSGRWFAKAPSWARGMPGCSYFS